MGYLERLDSYKEEMLATLAESVSKPSVKADPARTKDGEVLPFGQGVHEALLHMLAKGKELGFDVSNDDNYGGHIEWKAENAESDGYFGVIVHIDVVPAGSGWSTDPFVMADKDDGFVYGRGVSDDKGPVVASLYALKALKDEGIEPRMNVRLVLGCDEETGNISADHYTESFGHPVMGFTPDGDFPVVNGEMGILVFELDQKFSSKPAKEDLRLTRLEGGTAHNAVPASARAVLSGSKDQYDAIIQKAAQFADTTGYRLSAKKQGSALVLESAGIAAHGARPDLGLNAVSIMMAFLGEISFASEELCDFIAFYNDHIGFDIHGERIGCEYEDGPSGPLIFNVGIANINEEIASISVNVRYPVSCTDEEVLSGVESVLDGSRIGIVTRIVHVPVFMDIEDTLPRELIKAYVEETGDDKTGPITSSGGTYAKMFDNVLAFGAQFPGEDDTMHQADEKLSKDSLMKMARIFARAVYSLCCK